MRSVYRSDQFVKFQLHGSTVPILSVLDQEYHKERNDGSSSVYGQLPGVVEAEYRTASRPTQEDEDGGGKGGRVPRGTRSPLGKTIEKGLLIHFALLCSYPIRRKDTKANGNFP